jgi:hypothetical protein
VTDRCESSAPEVSREAADRMAETLGQDDEDQADEPEVAELEDRQGGRRMKTVAARVAARLLGSDPGGESVGV